MFKLKRDAGGFEGKDGEKRARRRAMGRRVVRVGGRVLAVAAVAGVVAANVAMAMMGDTVESYLGGDKIEVTSEEKDATMQAGAQLAQRIEGEGLHLTALTLGELAVEGDIRSVAFLPGGEGAE